MGMQTYEIYRSIPAKIDTIFLQLYFIAAYLNSLYK
jgi:hypothetical protein